MDRLRVDLEWSAAESDTGPTEHCLSLECAPLSALLKESWAPRSSRTHLLPAWTCSVNGQTSPSSPSPYHSTQLYGEQVAYLYQKGTLAFSKASKAFSASQQNGKDGVVSSIQLINVTCLPSSPFPPPAPSFTGVWPVYLCPGGTHC